MSDMIDDFRALDGMSKARRTANREESPKLLDKAGIVYSTHNLGAHLIIYGKYATVDFWPGTGLWIDRNSGRRRRGVFELIKYIKPLP